MRKDGYHAIEQKTVFVIFIGIAINSLMNIENAIDSMVEIERI